MSKRKLKRTGSIEKYRWSTTQKVLGTAVIAGSVLGAAYLGGLVGGGSDTQEAPIAGDPRPEGETLQPNIVIGEGDSSFTIEMVSGGEVTIQLENRYGAFEINPNVLGQLLEMGEQAVVDEFGEGAPEFQTIPVEFDGRDERSRANAYNSPNYAYAMNPDREDIQPFSMGLAFNEFRVRIPELFMTIKYTDLEDTREGALDGYNWASDYINEAYGRYGITSEYVRNNSLERITAALLTAAFAQEAAEGLYSQQIMIMNGLSGVELGSDVLDIDTDNFSEGLTIQVFNAVMSGQMEPLFRFENGFIDGDSDSFTYPNLQEIINHERSLFSVD